MRQVWITRHGGPEVLTVRATTPPNPEAGQVRIGVAFAGVNFSDVLIRLGKLPDGPRPPCVVGFEVAGVVDALGPDVDPSWMGRRVMALTPTGGYSESVCAPLSTVFEVPSNLTNDEGAAIPISYVLAHFMLVRTARVTKYETVLIHSAAGGVGIAAVQLCHFIGARILGAASPAKHDYLRSVGVEPIDSSIVNWPAQVLDLTDGRGADVALDPLGGKSLQRSYDALAPGGRLLCFGRAAAAAGERPGRLDGIRYAMGIPKFSPDRLMHDGKGVFGVSMTLLLADRVLLRGQVRAVLDHVAAGRLKPRIDSVYEFGEAAEAHRRLQSRMNVGKVLLKP